MGNILNIDRYESPVGPIWIVSKPEGIVRVVISHTSRARLIEEIVDKVGPVECLDGGWINQFFMHELDAYYTGSLKMFQSRPLLQGTSFQNRVWRTLCSIPYGTVKTYGEVATLVGEPKACRAVGQANSVNPLPILVPCHRVVGRRGIGGYSSGIAIKQWLLDHEARNQER